MKNHSTLKKLIVVGAGPKAIALAAKNSAFYAAFGKGIQIHIIEKNEVAAHWNGKWGLTDGYQPLGTPPEKDVGFPYHSSVLDEDSLGKLNAHMGIYSWASYLQEKAAYASWIDRGHPSPLHKEWADYLLWAFHKVERGAFLHQGNVTKAEIIDNKWLVHYQESDGSQRYIAGDGLVLTGPGIIKKNFDYEHHPNILCSQSFWPLIDRFRSRSKIRVALSGMGESMGVMALALRECCNPDLEIDIISPKGIICSRGESYFENRIFSDPEKNGWADLTWQDRENFISRTDLGVISPTTLGNLIQHKDIKIIPGKILNILETKEKKLSLSYEYDRKIKHSIYDYVIFSNGFDHLEFLKSILDDGSQKSIYKSLKIPAITSQNIQKNIDEDLSLKNFFPKLYLPMLAGLTQGPGFANLSSLGCLSDRILMPLINLKG